MPQSKWEEYKDKHGIVVQRADTLLNNASYRKHEIIVDRDGPVSVFEHVSFRGDSELVLDGSYIPITCTSHYFHFLKEYLGFYLYWREKYDPDVKFLWLDNNIYYPPHQDMQNVCDWAWNQIIGNAGVRIHQFTLPGVRIEKLVVLFDNAKCITSSFYRDPDYNDTPGINGVLRRMVLRKIKPTEPAKLFLSRRIVSEHLPVHPEYTPQMKKWKEHQLSLRYVEPERELEIEREYADKGYEIVQLSGMSIIEQASMFNSATHVAGLIGTAFYNGIFANEQTEFEGLRINPVYFYDFAKEIRSVLPNAKFTYRRINSTP